ncbi:hypothetical protein JCM11641_001818 [Rhodosporidiobolus odoratus]
MSAGGPLDRVLLSVQNAPNPSTPTAQNQVYYGTNTNTAPRLNPVDLTGESPPPENPHPGHNRPIPAPPPTHPNHSVNQTGPGTPRYGLPHYPGSSAGVFAPFQPPQPTSASAPPGRPSVNPARLLPYAQPHATSRGPPPSFAQTPAGQVQSGNYGRQNSTSRLPPVHQPASAHSDPGGFAATARSVFLQPSVTHSFSPRPYQSRASDSNAQSLGGGANHSWSVTAASSQPTQQDSQPHPPYASPSTATSYPADPPQPSYQAYEQVPPGFSTYQPSPADQHISLPPPSSQQPVASFPTLATDFTSFAHIQEDDDDMSRKAISFQPSDPSLNHPSTSNGPSRSFKPGPGRAGWQSGGFYEDSQGQSSSSRAHQPAEAPQPRRTSGVNPNRMFNKAMSASVSTTNRGGPRVRSGNASGNGNGNVRGSGSGSGKGKGKAVDLTIDSQGDGDSQMTTGDRIKTLKIGKNHDRQGNPLPPGDHSSHAAYASTSQPVSAPNFHGGLTASTSSSSSRKRILHNDAPDTPEMEAGKRKMEETKASFAIKGTAQGVRGKQRERGQVISLLGSDAEEEDDHGGARGARPLHHRHEDEEDPIDDEFDHPPAGKPSSQPPKRKPRVSAVPAYDDEADTVPSSPDNLAIQGRSSKTSAKRKSNLWNAETHTGTSVQERIAKIEAKARTGVAAMSSKKRPFDGSGNADFEYVEPAKGRAPRASLAASEKAKKGGVKPQGIGQNIIKVSIKPPLIARQGVLEPSQTTRYSFTLTTSGKHQKVTVKRDQPGQQAPDEVVEFKANEVANVGFYRGSESRPAHLLFRFSSSWNQPKWDGFLAEIEQGDSALPTPTTKYCADQELPVCLPLLPAVPDKHIHIFFDNRPSTDPEAQFTEEDLIFAEMNSKKWPHATPDSDNVARTSYDIFTACINEYVKHDESARRHVKQSTTGRSGKAKTSLMSGQGILSTHFFNPAAPSRQVQSLKADHDGDLIVQSDSTRSSSRASTSQFARPENRLPSTRQEFSLDESNDGSDEDLPEVTIRRAAPVDLYPPEKVVLEYPLQRMPGTTSVSLTYGDTKRLREDEFLNDTLIEFGLKRAVDKLVERDASLPEDQRIAPKVHIFNSFFYKQLSTKKPPRGPDDHGYSLVKKWTKRVNIFEKKYIVVPINEHLHWYLAIIVNPAAILHPPIPPEEPRKSGRNRQSSSRAAENGASDGAINVASSSSQPGPVSPAETTSPHFARPKPAASGPVEDAEMPLAGNGEGKDEAAVDEESPAKQRQHELALAAKESASSRGANDNEMLHLSSEEAEDGDGDVTMARPEVEGGGPPKHVAKKQDEGKGEDSIVGDSAEPESLPPSGQQPQHQADGAIILGSDDDDPEPPASPQKKHGTSKAKPQAREVDQNAINVDALTQDDDKASGTTTSSSSDSGSAAAVEQDLLTPSSAQAPAPAQAPKQKKPDAPPKRVAVPFGVMQPPPSPKRARSPCSPPKQQHTDDPSQYGLAHLIEKVRRELPPDRLNECHVMIFDSLQAQHNAVITRLQAYLGSEAKAKLNLTDDEIAPMEARGFNAMVPQQPNYCDCGLYLLHFVEKFLSEPATMLPLLTHNGEFKPKIKSEKPVGRQELIRQMWDDQAARAKRAVMREEVGVLSKQYLTEVAPLVEEERRKEEEEREARKARKKAEREREAAERGESGDAAVEADRNAAQMAPGPPSRATSPQLQQQSAPSPAPAPAPTTTRSKAKGKKAVKPKEVITISDDDEDTPSPQKPHPTASAAFTVPGHGVPPRSPLAAAAPALPAPHAAQVPPEHPASMSILAAAATSLAAVDSATATAQHETESGTRPLPRRARYTALPSQIPVDHFASLESPLSSTQLERARSPSPSFNPLSNSPPSHPPLAPGPGPSGGHEPLRYGRHPSPYLRARPDCSPRHSPERENERQAAKRAKLSHSEPRLGESQGPSSHTFLPSLTSVLAVASAASVPNRPPPLQISTFGSLATKPVSSASDPPMPFSSTRKKDKKKSKIEREKKQDAAPTPPPAPTPPRSQPPSRSAPSSMGLVDYGSSDDEQQKRPVEGREGDLGSQSSRSPSPPEYKRVREDPPTPGASGRAMYESMDVDQADDAVPESQVEPQSPRRKQKKQKNLGKGKLGKEEREAQRREEEQQRQREEDELKVTSQTAANGGTHTRFSDSPSRQQPSRPVSSSTTRGAGVTAFGALQPTSAKNDEDGEVDQLEEDVIEQPPSNQQQGQQQETGRMATGASEMGQQGTPKHLGTMTVDED